MNVHHTVSPPVYPPVSPFSVGEKVIIQSGQYATVEKVDGVHISVKVLGDKRTDAWVAKTLYWFGGMTFGYNGIIYVATIIQKRRSKKIRLERMSQLSIGIQSQYVRSRDGLGVILKISTPYFWLR